RGGARVPLLHRRARAYRVQAMGPRQHAGDVGAQVIRCVVVGHHARRAQAEALAASLDAHLCMDEADHGAMWNHRRALTWAAAQPARVIVLEDDAQPVPDFMPRAAALLARHPREMVSLYLGTGR